MIKMPKMHLESVQQRLVINKPTPMQVRGDDRKDLSKLIKRITCDKMYLHKGKTVSVEMSEVKKYQKKTNN